MRIDDHYTEIHIVLTEEEADTITLALNNWEGPYKESQLDQLTDGEKEYRQRRLDLAEKISHELYHELLDRSFLKEALIASRT